MAQEEVVIKPQAGPQEAFLRCSADVAFYGGAAGGGKTFAMLLDPLGHVENPGFGATIFRRTMPQIKNEGGVWDESMKLYPFAGAKPNLSEMFWKFPSGATISFSHLEHEKNVFDWQGAQIAMIGFEELTHFTRKQFFYMLSRNRSTCGVKPYVRATMNPEKKSWVRSFIDWWIYPKNHERAGCANPERSGVVRYFMVKDDKVIWKGKRSDFPEDQRNLAKSFTFIAANIFDNKILMEKDPSYIANLNALPKVDRDKLLGGNWDAEEIPGEFFRRSSFPVVKVPPGKIVRSVRAWDRAASEDPDADWTSGLKLCELSTGQYMIAHVERFQKTPLKVEQKIVNIAEQDGVDTTVAIYEDPGSAGKTEAAHMVKKLAGFSVEVQRTTTDKVTHAKPVSSQVEAQNVLLLEGAWNEDFLSEAESFPDPKDQAKDDQIDSLSLAFDVLVNGKVGKMTDEYEAPEEEHRPRAAGLNSGRSW